MPLSVDQTGFSDAEARRIRDAYPGEYDCIDDRTGRLVGLAVTHAFGDGRWKYPLEALETMHDNHFGHEARPKFTSPPYLTAEPEVIVTKVRKGDVLTMAGDGLWIHHVQ